MNDTNQYPKVQPQNWKSKISLYVNAILCFFFFNVRLMFNGSYLGIVLTDMCWFLMCIVSSVDVIIRIRHNRFKTKTGLVFGILAMCLLVVLSVLMVWTDRAEWLTLFNTIPHWFTD